ncbi:hypothetical protein LINPERHAP1_LOCUS26346, partial [Linum perenne]
PKKRPQPPSKFDNSFDQIILPTRSISVAELSRSSNLSFSSTIASQFIVYTVMMSNRYIRALRNGKMLQFSEKDDGQYILVVQINVAQGIDEYSSHPELGITDRSYRVGFWVDPEDVFSTSFVRSWTNPEWKEVFRVPVDRNSGGYTGYLSLEVERDGEPIVDVPSTSGSRAVVGRAKVMLPELGQKKGGKIGLVRLQDGECKAEGCLFIGMELKKLVQWKYNY